MIRDTPIACGCRSMMCSLGTPRPSGPNPAMTPFTLVHHEADWIFPGKILAWQTPFFALRSTPVLHRVVLCVYGGGRVGPPTGTGHWACAPVARPGPDAPQTGWDTIAPGGGG